MNIQYRLIRYLRSYVKILILAVVCAIFVTLCTLAIPWFLGKGLIDKVIVERNLFLLNLVALGIIAAVAIKGVFYYLQTYLASFIGYKVVTDMRNQIFQHLQKLSLSFYKKRRTGEIMSRAVNDANLLQDALVNNMMRLALNLLLISGILVFIFYIDWHLSLFVLVVFPFLIFVVRRFGSRIKDFSSLVQMKIADISSILQEVIGGIEVIKSFTMEEREVKRFQDQNIMNFRLNMKRTRIVAILPPIVEVLTTLGLVAILWYGGP